MSFIWCEGNEKYHFRLLGRNLWKFGWFCISCICLEINDQNCDRQSSRICICPNIFFYFSTILLQVLFYSKSETGSIFLFKICIIVLSRLYLMFSQESPDLLLWAWSRHLPILCILRAIIQVIKISSHQPIRAQYWANWPIAALGAKQKCSIISDGHGDNRGITAWNWLRQKDVCGINIAFKCS